MKKEYHLVYVEISSLGRKNYDMTLLYIFLII